MTKDKQTEATQAFKSPFNVFPGAKQLFVSKIFGKLLLYLLWAGLIVSNMMCLIRMRQTQFIDWVILSCAAFFSLVFIIDTLLYMILAALMLKPLKGAKPELQPSSATVGLGRHQSTGGEIGTLSEDSDQEIVVSKNGETQTTNDKFIEYYTTATICKNSQQQQRESSYRTSKCAELFVLVFIGKEKMKDLRRRLNPYNPI